MKEVLLSAKGPVGVYLVPDRVKCKLKEYCIKYVKDYLKIKTYQKELRFNETDFIKYLNNIFPNEKSIFKKPKNELIDEIKESKSLKVNKKITYNNDNLTFFQ